MNIRPNRVKQLAAGHIATIMVGNLSNLHDRANEPGLIHQSGTLDVGGIWVEGEHVGFDYADLGNLTRACDLWARPRSSARGQRLRHDLPHARPRRAGYPEAFAQHKGNEDHGSDSEALRIADVSRESYQATQPRPLPAIRPLPDDCSQGTDCPRSPFGAPLRTSAFSWLMRRASRTSSGAPPLTSIRSSKASGPAISRSSGRRSSTWSSISRPRRRSA
jgi:hypothetical protein